MKSYDTSIHQCRNGKRYTKGTDVSHGDCRDTFTDYVVDLTKCISSGVCLSYVSIMLKMILILSLPYLTDIQTRLLVHAALNCISITTSNTVRCTSAINFLVAAVLLLGVFVFNWNIRNGDGFLGPVIRSRERTGGRFK